MKNENEIMSELNLNGFAKYKNSIILKSDKMDGWFMDKDQLVFAPSLSELIFDLNDLQSNIDYDYNVKDSKSLLNAFNSFAN